MARLTSADAIGASPVADALPEKGSQGTDAGHRRGAPSDRGTTERRAGGHRCDRAEHDRDADLATRAAVGVNLNWGGVQIAPDGRRLAFSLADAANFDVWTYDAARDAPTRLTFDPGVNRNPRWTPDGRRLVYSASRGGTELNLYWKRADGSGDATRLTTSPNVQHPGSWDPSGRFLAFQENRLQTGYDR